MEKCMKTGPKSQETVAGHLHNRDNHLYSINLPILTLDDKTKTDGQSAVAIACAICSYEFHDPNEMTEHMKTHDNPTWGENSTGSLGTAGNVVQLSQKRSELQTDVVPSFTCDLCGYRTNMESELENHILVHTDRNHTIEHIQEKPYICKICNFSCLNISELCQHKKGHKRPFVCPICQFAYSRKSDLTQHIKTDLCKKQSETFAIPEFTCDICNYKTETLSWLKKHLLMHWTEKFVACDICSRKFKTKKNLKQHKLIHLEVKPFSCETCQLSFSKSQAYKWHRMQAHTGERPFKCDKCPASFVRRDSYKNHMEITHSTDRPFACSKCSYRSKTSLCLREHQLTHTEERSFICSMCPCAYKRSKDLKNHILKIHEGFKPHACPKEGCDFRTANVKHLKTHALTHSDLKLFHCNKCDFKTTRLSGLYRHKLTHTDRKPYRCPLCKLSCRALRQLRQHVHTHFSNQSQCPLCEFTSESEFSLVEHVVEHTPEKPFHCKFCSFSCLKVRDLWEHRGIHKRHFVCPICHLTCRDKNHLTQHMKRNCKERSKTYGVQEFVCDICNFRTKTVWRLKNHMLRHRTERPFACDICDRKFKSERHLKRHKLTHMKAKPFSCQICQLSFNTSLAYKWHRMQAHTGERPFKCDKCTASFVRKTSYKKHMEITHSTDRPFACSKCSYTGKTLHYLQKHQVIHTEGRSFVCSMCPHVYKQSRDLKNHILKIHEGFKSYACPEEGCDFRTTNSVHLKKHALIHSDLKLFHCDKCDFKTTRLTGLYQHKIIHTDRKPHKCPVCKFSCHAPRQLRQHIHIHVNNRSQCPLCQFTSESKSSLVEHVVEHTPENPHHCKFCSFSCLKIRELWEHRRVHKKPFVCPTCHSSFRDKYDLTRHMKTNCKERSKTYGVQEFICDICNLKPRTMSRLKKHLLTHMMEKRYKCSICSNNYKDSASLKIHISRFHEAMKSHVCPQEGCEYRIGNWIELQKHAHTHSCLKLFPSNRPCHRTARLTCQNEGVQTHKDTKLHKCPVCQLSCSTSSCLKQHIQSHLRNKTQDEKPYSCDLCGEGFKMITTIKRHCLAHLTGKLYACSFCSRKYKDATELENHKRWHRRHRSVQSYSKSDRKGRQAQDRPRRTQDLSHHKRKYTNSKPYECKLCTFRSNHELELDQHILQHAERLFTCVNCPYKTHSLNQLWAHTKEKHDSHKSNMIVTDHDDSYGSSQVSHSSSESDDSDNENSQPEEGYEIVIEKDECVEDVSSFQGVIAPNCHGPQSHQNEHPNFLENLVYPNIHTKEVGSCIMNRSVMDIRDYEQWCSSSHGCQPKTESITSAKNSHSGEDCIIVIKKEECAEDAFGCREITNQHFHQFGRENQNFDHHHEVENQHNNHLLWAENQTSDHPLAENQYCDHHSWAEKQNSDHSHTKNQNHDHYLWTENQNSDEHPQPGIYGSEEKSQTNDSHEIIIMKSDQFVDHTSDFQKVIDPNFHNPVMEIHNSDGDCYQGHGYRITINPAYSKTCIMEKCNPIKSLMNSTDHEKSLNSLHLCGEDHNSTANSQLSEDHKIILVKKEVDKDGHDCQEIVTSNELS